MEAKESRFHDFLNALDGEWREKSVVEMGSQLSWMCWVSRGGGLDFFSAESDS